MSPTKSDRKIRPSSGNIVLGQSGNVSSGHFSAAVAAALHRQYGQTHAAIKSVVAATGANPRAVRNWFDGKNAPRGHHLIALMGHSDCMLEMVLLAAGRVEVLSAKRFADARAKLVEMIRLIDDVPGGNID